MSAAGGSAARLAGALKHRSYAAGEHVLGPPPSAAATSRACRAQQGVFFAFAAFSFVSAGLLALFAVETKGKSLVELERIFLGVVDGAEEDLIA